MTLWRNRDFTLLWTSQAISGLGAQISATATPLLVLSTTGSPAEAGLVGAAGSLPHLIANLPAGPLVDRWNRRRILLVSEVVAGAGLLTVPLAIWSGLLSTAQLCLVVFVQGLCFVFFGLAERAALPRVVDAPLVPVAIAHNEARSRGTSLAGPPLGGMLFGVDRALPFLVDGISYLIAAASLLLLRRDLQEPATEPAEPVWRAAVTGLRWMWRHRFVRTALALIATSNLVFQALILVIVVLAQQRGATAGEIGVMLGVYSAGGLAGALAAGRLHRHVTLRTVIRVWAALLPLFTIAPGPMAIGAVGALCAFAGPIWNVQIFTYASLVVPNELLGRVMSAGATLTWGVMPLGSLGAGFLLTVAGPIPAILVLSAIMLVAALFSTSLSTLPLTSISGHG
ncbi:MFS transporter [Actinoplanes sp. NPDC023714]|uniref:MFS transporter n=1 Tax=Actinoplanes sp. NPDC023714 TaxID=3154322 RepID=UPI0033F36A87